MIKEQAISDVPLNLEKEGQETRSPEGAMEDRSIHTGSVWVKNSLGRGKDLLQKKKDSPVDGGGGGGSRPVTPDV